MAQPLHAFHPTACKPHHPPPPQVSVLVDGVDQDTFCCVEYQASTPSECWGPGARMVDAMFRLGAA